MVRSTGIQIKEKMTTKVLRRPSLSQSQPPMSAPGIAANDDIEPIIDICPTPTCAPLRKLGSSEFGEEEKKFPYSRHTNINVVPRKPGVNKRQNGRPLMSS